MKLIIKPMYVLCFMVLALVSCNNEELFVEPTSEVVVEDDTTVPADDDTVAIPRVTTPCDFNLSNVAANATVIINCVMDLGGQSITLPAGVTLVYEGGDIVNGTINFGTSNVVSGELLNSSLTIAGTKPQMKDTTFNFDPKRWGIVEGWTTSAIAQKNNNILDGMMLQTRNMGVTTFKINKMDAYFETSFVTSTTTNQNYYPSEAVNVPSNFELIMTDETILRQYPVGDKKVPALLVVYDAENVTIRGGVLYGDRDIRVYQKENEEYGSHLLHIRSGRNVVVDGVKFTMASVGGLFINSDGFTFNPDYNPTNNVLIKNCVFDKNRMMSLVITDGTNIIIENNEFIDTAQPTAKSDAGVVRWAMNFEPVRSRDPITGELIEYQKVNNVIVRNNKERGSANGGFLVFAGDHVTFENNDMESQITFSLASNIKILNNTFNASEKSSDKPAIGGSSINQVVFDNLISGNTINGYTIGINADYKDTEVTNNTLINCFTAFQFKNPLNVKIHNNKITSTVPGSIGFSAHLAALNNVDIYNNEISVPSASFAFAFVNQNLGQENNTINISNNISTNPGSYAGFDTTNGIIKFVGNSITGSVWVGNTANVEVSGNKINTPNNHGILLNGTNINTKIQNNVIKYPTTGGFECIKIASTNNLNELSLTNNSCN